MFQYDFALWEHFPSRAPGWLIDMEKIRIISIVTPSLNQGEFIGDTINSVLSQEGDFYLDYQVIDGGSSDRTLEVIRQFEDTIQGIPGTIRLNDLEFHSGPPAQCRGVSYRWISEKDKGQAHAVNRGLRKAAGDVFAFLNSDDTYYPGTLRRITEAEWNNTDFIYGKGMWISRNGDELLPYPVSKPGKSSFRYQCTLCQPAVFMKKASIDKLGLIDEELDMVFDFEYWMRAVFAGMEFRFVDEFFAGSRFYDENKTMAQRESQARELASLISRYYRGPDSLLDRIRLLHARYTVHLATVKRVNRLMELIDSPVRHKF